MVITGAVCVCVCVQLRACVCLCVDALACIYMFVYASTHACVTKKVQQREAYDLNSSSDAACKGEGKEKAKRDAFS